MQSIDRRESVDGCHFKGILRARFLALPLLLLLSACLPGYHWGDDDEMMAGSQKSPALNRTYKTSFLSLQSASAGVRGQLMPDSGPALLTAFSTIETRKPPKANAAPTSQMALSQPAEPAIAPPEQTLEKFYSALAALASGRRSQPLSILHFGDDRIIDDHFAGTLREHLTGRFGSAGRGLMMPGLFPVRGVKVDRGGQWTLASAAADSKGPFGISGARMSSSTAEAWLRFTSAGPFDWAEVTLLTGPGRGTAIISFDGEAKHVPTATLAIGETSIRVGAKAREILIRPRGDGEISLLSVATGVNAAGIAYANLGLPGAAAWTPVKWDATLAARDLKKYNPDLIILGYGSREAFTDDLDARQYELRLRLVVDQIKFWAPAAALLIVGPPDAARLPGFATSDGAQVCRALNAQETALYARLMERGDERIARWHAPPQMEAVRIALRRVAASSGAFYWDWAKYMGGPCSVHAWASARPPLAAPDHITLTEAGFDRSARALFSELMTGYETYLRTTQAKTQAVASADAPVRPAKASNKKRP